jgi:RimJ/RimL family protein N-acetyltransferase
MKPAIQPFGDGVITLRPIEEKDLRTILEWRNRDEARIWFKSANRIALTDHQAWFGRYLEKKDDLFFIIEADGALVGQCAIYNIDRVIGSAEIGRFLAAPIQSGKGYITRGCMQLINFGLRNLDLNYLFLEVLERNARAADIYQRCGFVEEERAGGIIRMGMKRSY